MVITKLNGRQGFPKVLRTWGRLCHSLPPIEEGSSKFGDGGGGLSQYMGGVWGVGGLKMVVKNICERVYLLVKLPPISLQACSLQIY